MKKLTSPPRNSRPIVEPRWLTLKKRSTGFWCAVGSLDSSADTTESYPEHMSTAAELPELPRSLRAPEPVIAVGMAAWLVAAIVVGVTGWGGGTTLAVCLVGLGVGVLGTSLFVIQRAASRRGDRTAQRGLD